MTTKKKAVKKKTAKSNVEKTLGLWDHLSAVKEKQDPDYFKKISEQDKKSWNTWMVFRALSYTYEYIPYVAELERRCWRLQPEQVYKVLIDVIPKQKVYDKFIKGKLEGKFDTDVIDVISKHFSISDRESIDYLDIFSMCDEGKQELFSLLRKYGWDDKQIKKVKI